MKGGLKLKFRIYKGVNKNSSAFHKNPSKPIWNLFSRKENESVSIFNITNLDNSTKHIVLNISDEFISGTKNTGNNLVVPFSQYVNSFLVDDVFFIELVNESYENLIVDNFNKKHNAKLIKNELLSSEFIKITEALGGFIKKVEYINDDEDDFTEEAITLTRLKQIALNNKLDFLTFLIEDMYITLKSDCTISINTNDQEQLLEIIGASKSAIT